MLHYVSLHTVFIHFLANYGGELIPFGILQHSVKNSRLPSLYIAAREHLIYPNHGTSQDF